VSLATTKTKSPTVLARLRSQSANLRDVRNSHIELNEPAKKRVALRVAVGVLARYRHSKCDNLLMKLEAPPGFEPGVEVLQSGLAITKLLSRLAFWSALILVLPRFRRVLFPSCSQFHFPRKLLIFDLRFDRFSIVLFRACAQVPIAKSTVDLSGRNVRPSSKFGMSGFDPAWPPQHRGERELLPL
jgi:hypothetical protein